MEIKKNPSRAEAIKIIAEDKEKNVGHIFLYLIYNDLHEKPYGFLEDLFVVEDRRGAGIGGKLLSAAVEEAKNRGCYKLIGTSRNERTEIHDWYEKMGFKKYGLEFRIDF